MQTSALQSTDGNCPLGGNHSAGSNPGFSFIAQKAPGCENQWNMTHSTTHLTTQDPGRESSLFNEIKWLDCGKPSLPPSPPLQYKTGNADFPLWRDTATPVPRYYTGETLTSRRRSNTDANERWSRQRSIGSMLMSCPRGLRIADIAPAKMNLYPLCSSTSLCVASAVS